ncbi:hypothetical protein NJN40_11975 [Lacticaseibacillus paracasei]|uniref:hypothetical protein n=1 Tax=Lacticaseibacillus paracasei TaxID=1597 RepID=UPI001EDF4B39|nr:hypothetical protein [Lacticaseibacillus paracasei]MCG4285219.1 hypothetical protein [Lacticaseibacillus paracasei]UVH23366.1 hypothetical protein NJN40_11975 [Lacticaseibacillus paracasei]
MLKVVKRPKEYIAIKVPEDCEDVGKFVSNKFKENGIPIRVNARYGEHVVTTFGERDNQWFVNRGDMLVADYGESCGYVVHAMSQEKFNEQFMPANQTAEASPTLTAYGLCDSKLPDIEDVALPARPGFSESFIAELDKALNDYHQKQGQSSQRTSAPHVRIEFDDINDVPCVWVDGKRIDRSDTGLVSVSLDWHTKDPAATDHVIRAYKIEYLKGDHREGIAQGSAMGPDLFKNDIHAK